MKSTIQVIALAALIAAPNANGGLTVPESVDVGKVDSNSAQSFEFKVANKSDRIIRILAVKKSCTCTDVEIKGSEVLGPKQERVVSGSVKFGDRLGTHETSLVIQFKIDDATFQEKLVSIRGEVVSAVILEKADVDFGDVDLSSSAKTMTIIAERGNSGTQWDSIQGQSASKHVSFSVDEQSKSSYKVTIGFDPSGLPISSFRSSLSLGRVCKLQKALYMTGVSGEANEAEIGFRELVVARSHSAVAFDSLKEVLHSMSLFVDMFRIVGRI